MVNSFSDVQLKEYAKTAVEVAKSPWNLLKAQQYLQELCDANRKGGMQKPPKLHFIFNHRMQPMVR